MEKLTQFVSKSFENNNNNNAATAAEQCLNLTSTKGALETAIKSEDCPQEETRSIEEQKAKPAAKNWLISDTPKPPPPSLGVDLRMNSSQVIYSSSVVIHQQQEDLEGRQDHQTVFSNKRKWCEGNAKTPSPRNSYSSSSSPHIDLEDSKSCSELNGDRIDEEKHSSSLTKENEAETDNDKKICEFLHVDQVNSLDSVRDLVGALI